MNRCRRAPGNLCVVLLAAMIAASAAAPDASAASADRLLSHQGNIAYLAAGTLLPLLTDGSQGKSRTFRTADAELSATLVTELLKFASHEQRPDKSDRESLPSGHATASFAVAAMEAQFHPRQAIDWFAGAALISASRVTLHRHFIHDVLAGALVGYGMARLELSCPRGLLLYPFPGQSRALDGLAVSFGF